MATRKGKKQRQMQALQDHQQEVKLARQELYRRKQTLVELSQHASELADSGQAIKLKDIAQYRLDVLLGNVKEDKLPLARGRLMAQLSTPGVEHIPSCYQLNKTTCPARYVLHDEDVEEHWWSGWPGAYCMKCGSIDVDEYCVADCECPCHDQFWQDYINATKRKE